MSNRNNTSAAATDILSKDEQKQLLLDAIAKRFPDTNFKEWPYIYLGHLLNWDGGGLPPFEFIQFFTKLLIYLAKHNLTDSFLKEVDEEGFKYIERLIHFFSYISDTEEHYAFVRYFMFKTVGCDAQEFVNAAHDYLTGDDRKRVLASNPDRF